MKHHLLPLALAGLLAGCADNTAIVTGQVRPAISPDAVKLYLEPPAKYEVIALVSGSSHNKLGISRRAKTDAATRGIREEAAKIGANGIIIQTADTEVSGGGVIMTGGAFVGGVDRDVVINGTAIHVP